MGILGGLGVCNSHFFVMFLFSCSSCISCCISTINFYAFSLSGMLLVCHTLPIFW